VEQYLLQCQVSGWYRNESHLFSKIGAAIFGIGWGLGGFCPGPAITSILTGSKGTFLFVMTMILGMVLAKSLVVTLERNRDV